MSSSAPPPPPPPPSHSAPNIRRGVAQESEETSNEDEETYNQLYYMQSSNATQLETFNSTTQTSTGIDSSFFPSHATSFYDSNVPGHNPNTLYSQTFPLSQFEQNQPQLQAPQAQHDAVTLDQWEEMANDFAFLAESSYEDYQQALLHTDYVDTNTPELVDVPEEAMFFFNMPITPTPPPPPAAVQSQVASQSVVHSEALPSTSQQEAQAVMYAPPGSAGLEGEAVARHIVRYDDNQIPRHESWLLNPHRHPWVQSGRAYLCPCDSGHTTIVRRKNQLSHWIRFHDHGDD